jgi:hypothetical protein
MSTIAKAAFQRRFEDALGPYLPVDITLCCLAALPEADVGPYCSILAMQVTAVRTDLPSLTASFLPEKPASRLVSRCKSRVSSAWKLPVRSLKALLSQD